MNGAQAVFKALTDAGVATCFANPGTSDYAVLGLEMARVRDGELNAKTKSMLDLSNPALDWVNIASGFGVQASQAKTAEEFHRHFTSAIETKGPTLIECQVAIPTELTAFAEYISKNR